MSKSFLLLFYYLFLIASDSIAQNGINELGAKPASMGYAYSTIEDRWAVFNNPGGIGNLRETSAIAAFQNRYNISGLNSLGAAFVTKLPTGALGTSLYRFGNDLYNEQIASLIYGNKFGIASLGLRVNYLQYTLEGLGSKGIFTFDFGGTATITEFIKFGAYIRNISQTQISEINDQRAPTVLYAGISFNPSEKLMLAIETEKDVDLDPIMKVGLEYQFLKKFYGRTGIKTNDLINYFGLGFLTPNLAIDYTLSFDSTLGTSHQASLSYFIKK